jgi:long-subunit fatty acid transport protein
VPPFFLVPVTVEKTNSGWGGVGQFEVSYIDGMTRYAISALHDINVTFSDGPTELTSVRFSVNHSIRDEWSARFSASWSHNRNSDDEFSSVRRDETTYELAPSLSWTPVREWTLTAGYSYLWLHDDEEGTDADRHLTYLEATFGMSLFDIMESVAKMGGGFQPGRLVFPDNR